MKKEYWIWIIIIIILIVVGVLVYMGSKRVQYSPTLSDEEIGVLVRSGEISEEQAASLRGGEFLETAGWWPFPDHEPPEPPNPCDAAPYGDGCECSSHGLCISGYCLNGICRELPAECIGNPSPNFCPCSAGDQCLSGYCASDLTCRNPPQ